MQRKFVTIFPVAENVHLIKDVGQIPYNLFAHHGYESSVVCYQNSEEYSHLNGEVEGLNIQFLEPQGRKLFLENAVLDFLNKQGPHIDVLNLYHLTKETIYYGLHYKKVNPNGVLYVKMDVYNEMLENGIRYSKKALFNAIHKVQEGRFLKALDLVSCENPISLQLLQQTFPKAADKMVLVPNGVNDGFVAQHFPQQKSFEEKENIVLSVGRIDSAEKNYYALVDTFLNAQLKHWKLVLVGPADEQSAVMQKILQRIENNDRVVLTGAIHDRKALFEYFNRSKVFCLTSPFESFGIAFAEAQFFGNFLVGNDGHSSFDLLSDNGQLGFKADRNNVKTLEDCFEQIEQGQLVSAEQCAASRTYAKAHFSWSTISNTIADRLAPLTTKTAVKG